MEMRRFQVVKPGSTFRAHWGHGQRGTKLIHFGNNGRNAQSHRFPDSLPDYLGEITV
jgi:hypothetical protein